MSKRLDIDLACPYCGQADYADVPAKDGHYTATCGECGGKYRFTYIVRTELVARRDSYYEILSDEKES